MSALHFITCLLKAFYFWFESIVLFSSLRGSARKSIEGDIALVTGGGSGIGRLTALRLAKRGAKIVTWDISQTGNEETVRMVRAAGGQAFAYTCDITNREEIYKLADKVKREVGKVSILVNNAGIVTGKSLLNIPDHLITKTMEVNVLAHFWTVKAFLPDMLKAKKGHIVNIASLAGMSGLSRLTDYCASKFAAVGFHESLTAELMSDGHSYIKTTCICPYFINTGMFAGVQSRFIPLLEQDYVADRIVTAILLNEPHVIIPGRLIGLFFMKLTVSYSALYQIGEMLELLQAMDEFRGRGSTTDEKTANGGCVPSEKKLE